MQHTNHTGDQELRSGLHDLANKEIPDDMNLIPEVQAALRSKPARRSYPILRGAAASIALLLLSTMTVVATAVFVQQRGGDPGLQGVDEQGLFTEINAAQTVDGVTVALQRGYADANRIALSLQLTYDRLTAAYPDTGFELDYRLVDAVTGAEIPSLGFGGGGGGGSSDRPTFVQRNADINFDTTALVAMWEAVPESLDLVLEVTLRAAAFAAMPPSGGGGGGGGSSPADIRPTAVPSPTMIPAAGTAEVTVITATPTPAAPGGAMPTVPPPDRTAAPVVTSTPVPVPTGIPAADFEPVTLTFDFALPFIPEYVVPGLEPASANDVTVRVERISVTPSLTLVAMCHTLPDITTDPDAGWLPVITLDTGAMQMTLPGPGPLEPDDAASGEQCFEITFTVPYVPDTAPTWTLTVERLRSSFADTEANAQRLLDLLAEAGLTDVTLFGERSGEQVFSIGLGAGGSGGEDPTPIIEDAYAQLGEQVTGPWSFTFDLP